MAFSFGNLLATAASARAGARRGQREQQQLDAEAERQARLDQFNEYARSRQLAQTDNAQDQRRYIEDEKRRTDWEKAQLLADVNKYRTNTQYGPEGSVDRTNASRSGDVRATNTSRETVADKNNAGQLQRVQITVAGQDRRDDVIVELPNGGGFARVDARGKVTPIQGTPYEKPSTTSGGGGGGSARPLTASQQNELMALRDGQRLGRQLLDDLEAAGGKAAGPIDMFTNKAANFAGVNSPTIEAVNKAQSSWQQLTSKRAKDLFGAALTKNEESRIDRILPPLGAKFNDAAAKQIAKNLKAELEAIYQDRMSVYQANGNPGLGGFGLPVPGADVPAPAAPSGGSRFSQPPKRP